MNKLLKKIKFPSINKFKLARDIPFLIILLLNVAMVSAGDVTFQAGNLTANYFIGNGSYLTDISFLDLVNIPKLGNTTAEINAVESDPQFDAKILANRSENVTFDKAISVDDAFISGKVGIGTATPGEKLDIVGNTQQTSTNPYLKLRSTATGSGGLQWFNGTTTQNSQLVVGSGGGYFDIPGNTFLNFREYGLWNSLLYLDGANNRVGIGTTTPQASLVVSNAGAEGIEMYKNIGSNTVQIQAYNRGASSYSHMAYNAGSHIFKIGGVEKARIHTNNYFGIGTTTPTHTFNNYGTTNLSGDTIIEGDLSHLKAVWKQDSTTIQSDITSTEDTQLNLTIPSAGLWTFENTIFVTTTTTADFRFGYTLPVSSNGLMHYVAYSGAVSIAEGYTTETGDALSTVIINYATAPAIDAIVVDGWFQATAPGRIALIWAQGTSQAADTTVWARSYMKAVRGD